MPSPPSFVSSLGIAATAFGLSRLLILACAWVGLRAWGVDAAEAAVNWRPFSSSWHLIDAALRYDAQWYLTIARDGYTGVIGWPYFDMRPNFMPLFPLMIRGLASLGVPLVIAGLAVANACSLLGLACLHQVLARRSEVRVATVAVWAVAVFPSSLFLSSVYSEGPLMAFTMGAWMASMIGRPGLAGALALGATLTRPLGVIVLIPLVAQAWRDHQPPSPKTLRAGVLVVAPSAAGLLGYLWWAQRTWGDALMLTRTQAMYRGETSWPWTALARWWAEEPALHGYANSSIDALLALGAVAAILALVRRGWLAGAAFGAAAVLVPLSSGLTAFSRMVLAAPILALPLATPAAPPLPSRWRHAWFLLWWLASLGILAWFSARFATWRWVA